MKTLASAIVLIHLSVSASAQEQCSTVAQCAQRAMEAAYQAKLTLQIAVPKGAVMAFNADRCPDGWAPFGSAAGRVIVGLDNGNQRFALRSQGGRSDIPSDGQHNHAVSGGRNEFGGRFGNDNTDDDWTTVANGAHNHGGDNMPPFIALLYCERR